jgi:hypothetical protein
VCPACAREFRTPPRAGLFLRGTSRAMFSASCAELVERADMEVRGGTFRDYLSVLRRNGLFDEAGGRIRAADVFFLGGGT